MYIYNNNNKADSSIVFMCFFSFEITKTIELSVLLLFCVFICLLIIVRGDARFKEHARVGGEEGGGPDVGIRQNFPLFLVYPVDMPGI